MFKKTIIKRLMLWVLIPMCALVIIDTWVVYQQAKRIGDRLIDHQLDETAADIALILKERNSISIQPLTQAEESTLLHDPLDKIYYSVLDDKKNILVGNSRLVLPISAKNPVISKVGQHDVVGISIPTQISENGKNKSIWIQVAETTNKREQLEHETLLVILTPQLVLLLVSSIFIVIGFRISLKPIHKVNDAISSLSFRSTNPISEDVPKEIERLVKSINKLTHDLNSAIKSQDTFIVDFAHQIRTPLAGLLSQAELLIDIDDPEEGKLRLGYIVSSAEKLIRLINQLLKLAKNQPDALVNIELHNLDMRHVLNTACHDLKQYAELKKIDIEIKIEDSPINILGDEYRLYDLITNLIENAIKYSSSGSKIEVRLNHFKDEYGLACARLTVQDFGIGILPEELDKIFDRFYRGKNVEEFGTGVGLSIVKEIADFHHAKLEVFSDGQNKGTRFTVTFNSLS